MPRPRLPFDALRGTAALCLGLWLAVGARQAVADPYYADSGRPGESRGGDFDELSRLPEVDSFGGLPQASDANRLPAPGLPVGSAVSELAGPYELLPTAPGTPIVPHGFVWGDDPDALAYHVGGKGRAYYINDGRIEFTGQEATFAVEGVIDGGVQQRVGQWDVMLETQFFLNQPYDRNILVDSPERRAFARNFDVDTFQISQFYFAGRRDDVFLAAGRIVTPFGRFYFPNYLNSFADSPFIRSEAILFRETGVLAQWDPEGWVFTAALTNGGPEKDTNSSKALIARVGIDQEWFALGASVKVQDGIGSEHQKTFNQHVGVDAMIRQGRWILSGEAIYDEYGLRKPGLALDDITWGRSIYYRDLNNGFMEPLTGFGYYADLGYTGERWEFHLNYGDYFPQQTMGIAAHDEAIHRGLIKASYHFNRYWETYGIVLTENQVPLGFDGRIRYGTMVVAGLQLTL